MNTDTINASGVIKLVEHLPDSMLLEVPSLYIPVTISIFCYWPVCVRVWVFFCGGGGGTRYLAIFISLSFSFSVEGGSLVCLKLMYYVIFGLMSPGSTQPREYN
jgi:hypothetical protein